MTFDSCKTLKSVHCAFTVQIL